MDLTDKNITRLLQKRYGIIGSSKAMENVIELLIQAAPTDLATLITGETGTGKEVFANALHGLSKRSKNPFVSVNCGAIPETLLESELFGHEKGAFTSAYEQRKGFFEAAHRGTIFLDEIGEMPVGTQVKLLRILESGDYSRLGSSAVHKVDVRIIAATNRDLELEVQRERFRQDLYFRLRSVHILLPPLREHSEDIPELVEHFAKKVCEKLSLDFEGISQDALLSLQSQHWPGNIRELKNLIETIVTLEKGVRITTDILRRFLPAALPEYKHYPMPPESSLVKAPIRDEPQNFELGLIFKTLLEIKNEIKDLSRSIISIERDISELKMEAEKIRTEAAPIYEVLPAEDFVDISDSLTLEEVAKRRIESALKKHNGNRRLAAQELGMSERTMYRKISEYGL